MQPWQERSIITAPVTYSAADRIFVALRAEGTRCPTQARGLLTLKIRPGLPSAITTAWCASLRGRGAPIVTTTHGHSNPTVWVVGAEGDNQLHGFRGDSGETLFTGAQQPMSGLRHFQTFLPPRTGCTSLRMEPSMLFAFETALSGPRSLIGPPVFSISASLPLSTRDLERRS
jgi:hypothetical protein